MTENDFTKNFNVFIVFCLLYFRILNKRKRFLAAVDTCGDVVCKVNEECSGCGENPCTQYTCAEPIKPKCTINCLVFQPECVCKPYYHRLIANGPCVPLQCSSSQPNLLTAILQYLLKLLNLSH